MEAEDQGMVHLDTKWEEDEDVGIGAAASQQKKKVNHTKDLQVEFLKLPIEDRKTAQLFLHKYGPGENGFPIFLCCLMLPFLVALKVPLSQFNYQYKTVISIASEDVIIFYLS